VKILAKNPKVGYFPSAMKVIMIYGSENDKPFMQPARMYLEENEVAYDETVLSAHRNLSELIDFLADLEKSGEKAVILAIAGLAAALPGVVVMKTSLPVIGVPVPGGPLNGIDALLSISQLPGGVPATTVGLHSKAPMNAAMAAHRIISLASS
jgi:5-(carboxyamino)imidazole ribonucleotide mutase